MNIIRFFRNVVVTLALGVTATSVLQAQSLPLDYCSGYIANATSGNVTGLTGSNVTIQLAVQFTADYLAEYAGTQVTALRVGLPDANAYPESIDLWISTERDAEPLATLSCQQPAAGWLEAELSAPITIATGQELWVGARYTQSTKLSIISFAGQTDPHACFVARNGSWSDYSSRNFGSLSLGMLVSGNDLTRYDLSLSEVTANQRMLRPGFPLEVSGKVNNLGSTVADEVAIDCLMGNELIGSQLVTGPIAFGQSLPFSVSFAMPEQELTADLTIKARWNDGSVDEHADDNSAVVSVILNEAAPYRNMVVEEGTGTTCGYCVRGIVGMSRMNQQHADRFVGIAVHCEDDFATGDYSTFVMNGCNGGLPGALINRDGVKYNPHPDNLEAYFEAMPAFAEMEVKPSFAIEGRQLLMQAEVTFMAEQSGTDYRLALVLMEDSLSAIQMNYYAGGAEGPMGGFEAMDKYVRVQLMDVARGIYPSLEGAEGVIASDIEPGQSFGYSLSAELPDAVVNTDHLRMAALLIDAASGHIVQAGKTGYLNQESAIETVRAELPASGIGYDLMGRVSAGRGFVIRNGKLTIDY